MEVAEGGGDVEAGGGVDGGAVKEEFVGEFGGGGRGDAVWAVEVNEAHVVAFGEHGEGEGGLLGHLAGGGACDEGGSGGDEGVDGVLVDVVDEDLG